MISDSLWKLFGIILCVILLFVVPMKMSYARQDKIIDNIVRVEVETFSQQVRELGYINEVMLKDFMNQLHASGLEYEVSLEHLSKAFADNGSGTLQAYYEGTYEEEIYDQMAIDGGYDMRSGDFFFVEIRSKSLTKTQSLNRMFGISSGPGIYYKSGGIIRYGNG